SRVRSNARASAVVGCCAPPPASRLVVGCPRRRRSACAEAPRLSPAPGWWVWWVMVDLLLLWIALSEPLAARLTRFDGKTRVDSHPGGTSRYTRALELW